MEKVYEAEVSASAGRNGRVKSSDGLLDMDIRIPKEMGGSGDAANPEQLFAAAWSACFGTSITIAAGIEKVRIGAVHVIAKIAVLRAEGDFRLGAHLIVQVADVDAETTALLIEKAKRICSYSKATQGNINTTYEVA